MSKYKIFLFLLAFIALSCKKPIVSTIKLPIKERIKIDETNFLYLVAKSKIKFKDGNQDLSAIMHLRMKKDSVIWFSLTPGLGIEALRGMITEDSVYVINKINKDFMKYSHSFFVEKFNFSLNLRMIQALVLGNLCMPLLEEDEVEKKIPYDVLTQKSKNYIFTNYVNSTSYKLEKLLVKDNSSESNISISYNDFKIEENVNIAHNNLILMNFKNNKGIYSTAIEIDHSKIEFKDKEVRFPFNVPNRYEKSKNE